MIKTWLPTKAVQKLKVLNKSSLKEFVTPDQALKVWGGTDEYIFQFISEPKMSTSVDDNRKKVLINFLNLICKCNLTLFILLGSLCQRFSY